jgi:hypothetical protein
MVDLKDAVRRAKEYAVQVLELDPAEMLLEEIRPSDDQHWLITLSFNSRIQTKSASDVEKRMWQITPSAVEREYKSFRINKVTGDVEGMFNVQVA